MRRTVKVLITNAGNGQREKILAMLCAWFNDKQAVFSLWRMDPDETWFATMATEDYVLKLLDQELIDVEGVLLTFQLTDRKRVVARVHWLSLWMPDFSIRKFALRSTELSYP